jgi:hypothetical protein
MVVVSPLLCFLNDQEAKERFYIASAMWDSSISFRFRTFVRSLHPLYWNVLVPRHEIG